MFFASDNWAACCPEIAQRLVREAGHQLAPYGESRLDNIVREKFSRLFEKEVRTVLVGTGTAANALALASVRKTAGVIFCHEGAHIIRHEGGAVEHMCEGAKLVPVAGTVEGKMSPESLRAAIALFPDNDMHVGQKMAVSLSQATESGTIYTAAEIAEIARIAHEHGMKVHMDGARFANALVAGGLSPAGMTWKSGIDILSLGGTKNGCWTAEAVIFLNPEQAGDAERLRKRGGLLFSKSGFVAAQFDSWLENDLWLDLARHANRMAKKLADEIAGASDCRLAWETGSNQLFVIMKKEKAAVLRAHGAFFYDWHKTASPVLALEPDEQLFRFVTSFATKPEDVEAFCRLL